VAVGGVPVEETAGRGDAAVRAVAFSREGSEENGVGAGGVGAGEGNPGGNHESTEGGGNGRGREVGEGIREMAFAFEYERVVGRRGVPDGAAERRAPEVANEGAGPAAKGREGGRSRHLHPPLKTRRACSAAESMRPHRSPAAESIRTHRSSAAASLTRATRTSWSRETGGDGGEGHGRRSLRPASPSTALSLVVSLAWCPSPKRASRADSACRREGTGEGERTWGGQWRWRGVGRRRREGKRGKPILTLTGNRKGHPPPPVSTTPPRPVPLAAQPQTTGSRPPRERGFRGGEDQP